MTATISDKSNTSAERVKPDVAGKVKPLAWNNRGFAHPGLGVYFYLYGDDGFFHLERHEGSSTTHSVWQTSEAAKAFAQTKWQELVASVLTPDALAPIPAGEVAEMIDLLQARRLPGQGSGDPVKDPLCQGAADLLSRMAGERARTEAELNRLHNDIIEPLQ